MSYVSWEYYSSLFTEISKEEFARYNKRAEQKINQFTHCRVARFVENHSDADESSYEGMILEAVRMTVCSVMNRMKEQDNTKSGVASVSNNGYSESYAVSNESDRRAEIESIIRTGLQGTGLDFDGSII